MTSPSFSARVARARERRSGAAFTLIEAVVVLVIVGLLLGVAGVGYRSVSRHQADEAGKPLLGSAQTDARRAAASNGYQFPADLTARLGDRSAVVDGQGTERLSYTADASFAPNSHGNETSGYLISTASAGTMAAFAVETTPSHCWTMVDRTNSAQVSTGGDGERHATTWGYSEDVPPGQCKAQLVIACPDQTAAGTVDQPGTVELTECKNLDTVLSAVKCAISEDDGSGAAVVSWTEAADTTGVSGYRVYGWKNLTDQESLTDGALTAAEVVQPALGSDPMPVGTTEATVTALAAGTDYTFAVVPEGPKGEVDANSLAKLRAAQQQLPMTRTVPPAPAPLKATSSATSVTLAWGRSEGAQTYTVYRSEDHWATSTEVATVDALDPQPGEYTYEDTTAELGGTYSYKVRAASGSLVSNVCGYRKTSGGDGPDSVSVAAPQLKVDAPVLTAVPADIDGSWTSSTRPDEGDDVLLTWDTVELADGYRIYRNGEPDPIAELGADDTSYEDLDRPHGSKTTYTAVAFADAVDSDGSASVDVCTQMDAPVLNGAAAADSDGRTNVAELTWGAVSGAASYDLFRCVGAGCEPTTKVATLTAADTSYADNGTEGQTLRYVLTAHNAVPAEVDDTSSPVAQVTLTLPAPQLRATKTDQNFSGLLDDVDLTWPRVPGASGYRVYRAATATGPRILLADSTGTKYVDMNRPVGSTQYYTVDAYNTLTATPSKRVRVDISLDAPDLAAAAVADGSDGVVNDVRLTWPAVPGTGVTYTVYRVGTSAPVKTGLTALSWTDVNRPFGATYCYTAVATNASGTASAPSEQACADISLSAPTLTATDDDRDVVLGWTVSPGATGYRVYRDPTSTGLGTLVATLTGRTSTTWVDTARPWGSSTDYVVVATNAADTSAPSNVGTGLIVPAVPGAELAASYCTRCETQVVLVYPAGATKLALYRNGSSTPVKTFLKSKVPNGTVYRDPTGWGTRYRYQLAASNASGTSAKSEADTVGQPPRAPRHLQLASGAGDTMVVDWDASPNADRYYVYTNGYAAWDGTATRHTFNVTAGKQYTVQVYAFDSETKKFSLASAWKTFRAPTANTWGSNEELRGGLTVDLPWDYKRGYPYTSYIVNRSIGYCVDMWATGPGHYRAAPPGHRPWTEVSSFRKQQGYRSPWFYGPNYPGPKSYTGPARSNTEDRLLARALSVYGATRDGTTEAVVEHIVRGYTVGDSTQRNEENRRWKAVLDKYGKKPANVLSDVRSDVNRYEGPYTAKVTFLGAPTVGKTTKIRVSVENVDGRVVPDTAVTVVLDRGYSPGLVRTGADGVADVAIRADCSGTMKVQAFATSVTPTRVELATPYYREVQRVVRAGQVDKSPVSTYTRTIADS